MEIEGARALITGGASGIGYAYADLLLRRGAAGVVLVDISEEKAAEAAERLGRETGGRAEAIAADVSDADAWARVGEFALRAVRRHRPAVQQRRRRLPFEAALGDSARDGRLELRGEHHRRAQRHPGVRAGHDRPGTRSRHQHFEHRGLPGPQERGALPGAVRRDEVRGGGDLGGAGGGPRRVRRRRHRGRAERGEHEHPPLRPGPPRTSSAARRPAARRRSTSRASRSAASTRPMSRCSSSTRSSRIACTSSRTRRIARPSTRGTTGSSRASTRRRRRWPGWRRSCRAEDGTRARGERVRPAAILLPGMAWGSRRAVERI